MDSNNFNYVKYLKYKNKYLELKKIELDGGLGWFTSSRYEKNNISTIKSDVVYNDRITFLAEEMVNKIDQYKALQRSQIDKSRKIKEQKKIISDLKILLNPIINYIKLKNKTELYNYDKMMKTLTLSFNSSGDHIVFKKGTSSETIDLANTTPSTAQPVTVQEIKTQLLKYIKLLNFDPSTNILSIVEPVQNPNSSTN